MKNIFLLTVVSLFLAGCGSHPSDASIRRQIVGTWTPTPSNTVTVFADGSYKDVHADATIEGTWIVDGGFWTLTTTNISGTFKGARVGQVARFEVVRIGEHELACHLIGGTPENILIAKKPLCLTSRRSQPPLALSVPLSRFTSQVGGGSAFFVRPICRSLENRRVRLGLV